MGHDGWVRVRVDDGSGCDADDDARRRVVQRDGCLTMGSMGRRGVAMVTDSVGCDG